MRAHVIGVGVLAFGLGLGGLGVACLPDPGGDFDDYQGRLGQYQGAAGDGGGFDAAPPPTTEQTGLYYGACLSQLAFGRTDRVFNFLVDMAFTPQAPGGSLVLKLTPLELAKGADVPPPTVSRAGTLGATYGNAPPGAPVDAEGRYRIDLGSVTIPGDANPVSRREVLIDNAALVGRFAVEKFCARLNGDVKKPVTLTLDPSINVCLFTPIKDGDPTPLYTDSADFAAANCPE